jgi:glucan 1,3-beta-glucosidase
LLGVLAAALAVLVLQVALGLVFDPRYKDFPNPALAGPVVALFVLSVFLPRSREGGFTEQAIAAVSLASGVYIAFNESFANYQAQIFVVLLAGLAVSLLRSSGVRMKG